MGCLDYGYRTVNTPITITFSAAHVVYTCGLLSWDPDCSRESPSGRGSNRMDLTPFAQMCLIFVLFLIQKQAPSGKKSCVRSVCVSYLLETPFQGQCMSNLGSCPLKTQGKPLARKRKRPLPPSMLAGQPETYERRLLIRLPIPTVSVATLKRPVSLGGLIH